MQSQLPMLMAKMASDSKMPGAHDSRRVGVGEDRKCMMMVMRRRRNDDDTHRRPEMLRPS